MRLTCDGSLALAAGLGLSLAACGSSSSSKSTTPASSGGSSATTDTVTAINTLTGQGTSVALDAGTVKAITGLGLALAPYGTAKFDSGTGTITFPITSGYAEIHSDKSVKPGYILGSVEHAGSGFTLSAGGKELRLDSFVVDPGNSMLYGNAYLNGQLAAANAPLLTLDGTNVQVGMQGANVTLDGTVAKLTDTAAQTLNKVFGTTAVTAGLPLGTVHLVASGSANTYTDKTTEITRLSGVGTSVALDSNTAAALTKLGVALAPNGNAKFDSATSTVTFPITGGMAAIHSDANYKPGYIAGVVLHGGSGLTLTAGGKTVTLTDFVVDPGDSILTGTVNGTTVGVPLLTLDGTAVKVSNGSDGVHLDGTVAKLTQTAATALDQAFGTTALTAGIPLGVVHLIAAGTVSNG